MALAASTIRIVCTWSGNGFNGVNVWNGVTSVSGPPAVADAQVLVDRLRDFYTAIASVIASGTTITVGAPVVAIGQTPNTFVGVTPRTIAMTGAGELLPLGTTLTVKLRTPDATRRGRGRIFLGNLTESNSLGGVPIATALNTINTACNGLISSPFSTLPALAVLSKIGSGTPANPNPYTTSLQSAIASNRWSVLRSRRA